MAFCQLPVSWEQAVWWTQRPNAWWWLAAAVLWWKRVQREKPSWNCSRNICQKPLACRPTTRLWCAVASQRREASPTDRGQCCRITGRATTSVKQARRSWICALIHTIPKGCTLTDWKQRQQCGSSSNLCRRSFCRDSQTDALLWSFALGGTSRRKTRCNLDDYNFHYVFFF